MDDQDRVIEAHTNAILEGFASVLSAQEQKRLAEIRVKIASDEVRAAEVEEERHWKAISKLMLETGESEVRLPGSVTDYRILWSQPREKVIITDENAIPDSFLRELKREPDKKKIGAHLKMLRDRNDPLPNFATLERGDPTLFWEPVKK